MHYDDQQCYSPKTYITDDYSQKVYLTGQELYLATQGDYNDQDYPPPPDYVPTKNEHHYENNQSYISPSRDGTLTKETVSIIKRDPTPRSKRNSILSAVPVSLSNLTLSSSNGSVPPSPAKSVLSDSASDSQHSSSMIKEKRSRGVTWADYDDGHEPCRLQLRGVTRDLSLRLLDQEDQMNELRNELMMKQNGPVRNDIAEIAMRERDMALAELRKLRAELNHKAQEQALAIGEREAALRAEEDLRDQVDALSKECEGIKCDRDVALLALKQSVALKGEHEREQMEDLKKRLQEYEVRDEVALNECHQVRQENARMRMMYDLDRSAANRETAALQSQLQRLMTERDKASKERDDYKYQKDVIARDFKELVKQFKEPEMSDDSAIQEDQAPDGQSSNSDPSTVVIDKIEPGTLRDCVFAEGRMLTSGKKVHLIVRKDKPSQEGLHHVITTDSPVKRVSDIRLKHSGKRSLGKPVIKDTSAVSSVDSVVRSVTMTTPIKTVALSTSNSATSIPVLSVPQSKVGEVRTITITLEETRTNIGFEIVSGNSKSEGIFISKLLDQRLAKGKNTLNIGDEILSANGVRVSGMSEVLAMESIMSSSTVAISVKYNPSGYLSARYKFYVRALFDFKAISEAGLSFKFGQVLQVTDVESYTYGWWQACALAGGHPGRIGEVPSKDRADLINSCNEGGSNSSCSSEPGTRTQRSYQRVRAQPLSYIRPVVLMGALTSKFSKKLVKEMPGQYGYCVRYTTAAGAESELVKQCSRQSVLDLLKEEGRLIECKLKKGEYYYTSRDSVQAVGESGKHCVLTDGSMYMIDDLQKTGLHPIVILVKCKSAHEIRSVRNCSSEHAAKVIQKVTKLEEEHLSRFTVVVSGSNCDDIYKGIVSAINTHKDTLWLPTS